MDKQTGQPVAAAAAAAAVPSPSYAHLPGELKNIGLLRAGFKGAVGEMRELINKGADINFPSNATTSASKGDRPLHAAVRGGQLEAVKVLVKEGADVGSKNYAGESPLYLAACGGSVEIGRELVEGGAALDSTTTTGCSPLLACVLSGHGEMSSWLVSLGAVLNKAAYIKASRNEHVHVNGISSSEKAAAAGGANPSKKAKTLPNPLHVAALRGKQHVAAMLVEGGIDVMATNEDEDTPLHMAASGGHVATGLWLLGKGAAVDAKNSNGDTPLHKAAAGNHTEVAVLLAERGSKVDVQNEEGETPLHIAALHGHVSMGFWLAGKGAEVEEKNRVGSSPLHAAASRGHLPMVQWLVVRGAKVDAKNKFGATPTDLAGSHGHEAVKKFLISKGGAERASLSEENMQFEGFREASEDERLFVAAASSSSLLTATQEILELLEKGANINCAYLGEDKDKGDTDASAKKAQEKNGAAGSGEIPAKLAKTLQKGDTPLHAACLKGRQTTVELLLEKGANVMARNAIGDTPLHAAARSCSIEVLKVLAEAGADLNAKNKDGSTPMHYAAAMARLENMKFLHEIGADVSIKDQCGDTPIHMACANKHYSLAAWLIEIGAELDPEDMRLSVMAAKGFTAAVKSTVESGRRTLLNLTNPHMDGDTAMHAAARKGHVATVQVLAQGGADVMARNKNGETPIHNAIVEGHLGVADVLLAKGASVSMADLDGNTPLHKVALKGNGKSAKWLIDKGASVKFRNNDGFTPLHLCAMRTVWEQIPVATYLVEKGRADVNVKDEWGRTPLYLAVQRGLLQFCEFAMEKGAVVNYTDRNGVTALHTACFLGGSVERLYRWEGGRLPRWLIKEGAFVNVGITLFSNESTPLDAANYGGHSDLAKWMESIGAKPKNTRLPSAPLLNPLSSFGGAPSPSSSASAAPGALIVGPSGSKDDKETGEPQKSSNVLLYNAAATGLTSTVKSLLESGEDVDVNWANTLERGNTALHIAAQGGFDETMNVLIEAGAEVSGRNREGSTVLHLAVLEDQVEALKVLVEKKAELDMEDDKGSTALHTAALCGFMASVKILVDAGANVQKKNKEGETPLHLASLENHLEVAKLLVERGADVHAEDEYGDTPLDPAIEWKHEEMAAFLKGKMKIEGNYQRKRKDAEGKAAKKPRAKRAMPKQMSLKAGAAQPQPQSGAKRQSTAGLGDFTPTKKKQQEEEAKIKLNARLYGGSVYGQTGLVNACLRDGADVNWSNPTKNGYTPLHAAAFKTELEVVKLLLKAGANVGVRNANGDTPLHAAAYTGSQKTVEALVAAGADVMTKNKYGATPLHIAVVAGRRGLMEFLVEKGADVNARDGNGATPLHMAAAKGNSDAVICLWAKGAKVDTKNKKGGTPKDVAKSGGHEVVVRLLERHATLSPSSSSSSASNCSSPERGNVKRKREEEEEKAKKATGGVRAEHPGGPSGAMGYWRPPGGVDTWNDRLFAAALAGATSDLSVLLQSCSTKVNMNYQNPKRNGDTPLHAAAFKGHKETMTVLMEAGAKVMMQNKKGSTPLHSAAAGGQHEVAAMLIEKGADVMTLDKRARTPLHEAAEGGHLSVAMLLVKKGAVVDALDENENAPIHVASSEGQLGMVAWLVEKGAALDALNKERRTCLHLAAARGQGKLVVWLVNKGLCQHAKDVFGWTPLSCAVSGSHLDTSVVLMGGEGADLEARDQNGQTPLHHAVKGGPNIVRVLVERGADVNTQSLDGCSPLHVASRTGRLNVVRVLVPSGANVFLKNEYGLTPREVSTSTEVSLFLSTSEAIQGKSVRSGFNLATSHLSALSSSVFPLSSSSKDMERESTGDRDRPSGVPADAWRDLLGILGDLAGESEERKGVDSAPFAAAAVDSSSSSPSSSSSSSSSSSFSSSSASSSSFSFPQSGGNLPSAPQLMARLERGRLSLDKAKSAKEADSDLQEALAQAGDLPAVARRLDRAVDHLSVCVKVKGRGQTEAISSASSVEGLGRGRSMSGEEVRQCCQSVTALAREWNAKREGSMRAAQEAVRKARRACGTAFADGDLGELSRATTDLESACRSERGLLDRMEALQDSHLLKLEGREEEMGKEEKETERITGLQVVTEMMRAGETVLSWLRGEVSVGTKLAASVRRENDKDKDRQGDGGKGGGGNEDGGGEKDGKSRRVRKEDEEEKVDSQEEGRDVEMGDAEQE